MVVLLSTYDEDEFDLDGCGASAYVAKAAFGPDRLAEVWSAARTSADVTGTGCSAIAGIRSTSSSAASAQGPAEGLGAVEDRLQVGRRRAGSRARPRTRSSSARDSSMRGHVRELADRADAAGVHRGLHGTGEPSSGDERVEVQAPARPLRARWERRAGSRPDRESWVGNSPGSGRAAPPARCSSRRPARRARSSRSRRVGLPRTGDAARDAGQVRQHVARDRRLHGAAGRVVGLDDPRA